MEGFEFVWDYDGTCENEEVWTSIHTWPNTYLPPSLNLLPVTNFFTASRLKSSNGSYVKKLSLLIYTSISEQSRCDWTQKHSVVRDKKHVIKTKISNRPSHVKKQHHLHLIHRGKPEVYVGSLWSNISLFMSLLVILSNSFILSKQDLVTQSSAFICRCLTETKGSLTFEQVSSRLRETASTQHHISSSSLWQ